MSKKQKLLHSSRSSKATILQYRSLGISFVESVLYFVVT